MCVGDSGWQIWVSASGSWLVGPTYESGAEGGSFLETHQSICSVSTSHCGWDNLSLQRSHFHQSGFFFHALYLIVRFFFSAAYIGGMLLIFKHLNPILRVLPPITNQCCSGAHSNLKSLLKPFYGAEKQFSTKSAISRLLKCNLFS